VQQKLIDSQSWIAHQALSTAADELKKRWSGASLKVAVTRWSLGWTGEFFRRL